MATFSFLTASVWTPASTGTGDFVVSAASAGYYTPAQCANPSVVDGATYRYFARMGTDHEEGYGVYTASGTTLARTTILSSSNSGSKVSFSSVPTVHMGCALAPDLTALGRSTLTNAGPTGTTSTSQVMAGLAGAITPARTGNILIICSGYLFQSTATQGGAAQIRYGTGSAPANAAAATGTAAGQAQAATLMAASQSLPFSIHAYVSGLTVGTAYWVDLGQAAVGGGTLNLFNITLTVIEIS